MAAAYDDGDDAVDHYSVLGLPSGEEGAKLTLDDIRKAFRTESLSRHPDKRPGDPAATADFQRLRTSYDALCDPSTRRLLHDRIRLRGSASGEPYYNKRRRGDEEDPIESYWQRAARRRRREQAEAGHAEAAAYYKRRRGDEDGPIESYWRYMLRCLREQAAVAHPEALLPRRKTPDSAHQSAGGEEDSIQSLVQRALRRQRELAEATRARLEALAAKRAALFEEYGRAPV